MIPWFRHKAENESNDYSASSEFSLTCARVDDMFHAEVLRHFTMNFFRAMHTPTVKDLEGFTHVRRVVVEEVGSADRDAIGAEAAVNLG